MDLCVLGTGYGLEYYILSSGYSSASTGLVLLVPGIMSNSNSYLLNSPLNTTKSSSDKCIIYDAALLRSHLCNEHLRCEVYTTWRSVHVLFNRVLFSKTFYTEANWTKS